VVGSFEGDTGGLHARFGEEKNLSLLTQIEPSFLRYPVRILVTIKTALSRLPFWACMMLLWLKKVIIRNNKVKGVHMAILTRG